MQLEVIMDIAYVRFPLELGSLVDFLEPLSCDEVSTLCVYQLLSKMTNYCEEFNLTNQMAEDPECDNGWIKTTSISPFIGTWKE